MSTTQLRQKIKKAIDKLPVDRLPSVADYVAFLNRPTFEQRILSAEKDLKAGKGTNWRKVRRNV